MRARRYDAGALESARVRPLAAGGLAIPAFCTRVGVFPYTDANGDVRHELRLPEEVFDSASLASLSHAPVTIDHPPGKVDRTNWKQYAVGSIAPTAKPLDAYVQCEVVVNEDSAIARVDSRELVELSCGYDCDLYDESGEWNGIHYDLVQRKIRYNHVALLPKDAGRAGNSVALRLDSKDAIRIGSWNMALRIDGKEIPASEEQRAVDAVCAARDQANGRADVAEAKVKTLEAAIAKGPDPKAIEAAAKERARLLYSAQVVARKADKKVADDLSGVGNTDLMVSLIKLAGGPDVTGKSPDYILGVFEATVTPIVAAYAGETAAPVETPADPPTSPNPPPALDSIFQAREAPPKTVPKEDSGSAYQDMVNFNRTRGQMKTAQNGGR